ncbi:MAG: hypothetical protein DHS20C18_21610 [Saprospiraceae bacterium]|nr:MAG: hypothetical protein DHS20C18_21610 [Saprospiraceae bacterium]
MKGEFAEAVHFSKLAEPLKDSLNRRNDARHLEQLKQRLEAEKYDERIRLIEQEREFQKWLRNAALAIPVPVRWPISWEYLPVQYEKREAA